MDGDDGDDDVDKRNDGADVATMRHQAASGNGNRTVPNTQKSRSFATNR